MKEDTSTGVEVEGKTYLMVMWQLFTIAGEIKGKGRFLPSAGKDLIPRK